MRFSQFGGFPSLLAIFATDAILADTDWEVASNLPDSNVPNENWIPADPIAEADDIINSDILQTSDFFSIDESQLYATDLQPEWLADDPNGKCSSFSLAGKRRIKRSDETCSSDESDLSSYINALSDQTDFDKVKCSELIFFVKSLLVCSSGNILRGLPFDTLYDSRRGKHNFLPSAQSMRSGLEKDIFCQHR